MKSKFTFLMHSRPDLTPDAMFFVGTAKGYPDLRFDNATTSMTGIRIAMKVAEWVDKGPILRRRK